VKGEKGKKMEGINNSKKVGKECKYNRTKCGAKKISEN